MTMGRREFGVAGLSAAAAVMAGAAFAQPPVRPAREPGLGDPHGRARQPREADPHAEHDHAADPRAFDECSRACSDAQRACDATAEHCMEASAAGSRQHADALKMVLDCADMCAAAARVMGRHGALAGPVAEACVETCRMTASFAGRFGDDELMRRCAEACRRAGDSCARMIEMVGHVHGGGHAPGDGHDHGDEHGHADEFGRTPARRPVADEHDHEHEERPVRRQP